jgi:hypothetical protein
VSRNTPIGLRMTLTEAKPSAHLGEHATRTRRADHTNPVEALHNRPHSHRNLASTDVRRHLHPRRMDHGRVLAATPKAPTPADDRSNQWPPVAAN